MTGDNLAMNAANEPDMVRADESTSPLLEGLRIELRRLVDGDLDANFMQIEQLAARGRELLMVLKAPEAKLLNRPRPPIPTAGNSMGYYSAGINVATPSLAQDGMGVGFSPEQFGATSMRQITNIVPDAIDKIVRALAQGPQRMVAAIIAARSAGHDELADKLEERLLNPHDEHEDAHLPSPAAGAAHHHTNGAAAVAQPVPQPAE